MGSPHEMYTEKGMVARLVSIIPNLEMWRPMPACIPSLLKRYCPCHGVARCFGSLSYLCLPTCKITPRGNIASV
jgi:hypothetical protein